VHMLGLLPDIPCLIKSHASCSNSNTFSCVGQWHPLGMPKFLDNFESSKLAGKTPINFLVIHRDVGGVVHRKKMTSEERHPPVNGYKKMVHCFHTLRFFLTKHVLPVRIFFKAGLLIGGGEGLLLCVGTLGFFDAEKRKWIKKEQAYIMGISTWRS
jgi:hypothetical protein